MRRFNRTRAWFRAARIFVTVLFCSIATIVWPAAAQTQEPPAIQPHSGFELDSISAYTAYYPDGLTSGLVPLQGSALAPDVGVGAAATISWDRAGERSNLSVTYTADYSGRLRYSAWDALNHMFSLNASRHLTPLWDFHLTVAAAVITADQLVLLPGELLATAPLSPSLLLYGNRAFNSTVAMSLAYQLSTRTTLTWHAGGTHIQSLGNNDGGGDTGVVSFLNQASTASAGFEVSHIPQPAHAGERGLRDNPANVRVLGRMVSERHRLSEPLPQPALVRCRARGRRLYSPVATGAEPRHRPTISGRRNPRLQNAGAHVPGFS
jgi:hypothetical protein